MTGGIFQLVGAPETDFVDLLALKFKGTGQRDAEHPGILRFDLIADLRIEQITQRYRGFPAQFLGKFAPGSGFIIFARRKVAADGGIPFARLDVLGHGTFLQQDALPVRMEHHHVAGVVEQRGIAMALPARRDADPVSGGIVDIEQLFHHPSVFARTYLFLAFSPST